MNISSPTTMAAAIRSPFTMAGSKDARTHCYGHLYRNTGSQPKMSIWNMHMQGCHEPTRLAWGNTFLFYITPNRRATLTENRNRGKGELVGYQSPVSHLQNKETKPCATFGRPLEKLPDRDCPMRDVIVPSQKPVPSFAHIQPHSHMPCVFGHVTKRRNQQSAPCFYHSP